MRRTISLLLSVMLLITMLSSVVGASDHQIVTVSSSVEYLENGDYIVTELTIDLYESHENATRATSKTGSKTSTYYNSYGTRIWSVVVNGWFTYTYGVSSTATNSSAIVNIYDSNADFISKNAYTSGNRATATATVAYSGMSTTRSVSVTCDKYGNLS